MLIRKLSAAFLLSVLVLAVVAFAQDVSTDYDHHADFTK
jgi:hypothetical protein